MILTDVLSMESSLKSWNARGNADSRVFLQAIQSLFANAFLFLVLVSYLYGLFYMNLHFAANQIQVYHLWATYKDSSKSINLFFSAH